MNLKNLTDTQLHTRTQEVAKKEQATTLELLHHLHEIQCRRVYLREGYPTLWEYVRALGYGESQTSERISAMRLMFRSQETKQAVETGALGLTQAVLVERHLRAKEKEIKTKVSKEEVQILVAEVSGKSRRETEKILLSSRPRELRPEKVTQVTSEITEVRFPMTEETRNMIDRYWELHGKCPVAEVFSKALGFYLKKKDVAQQSVRLRPVAVKEIADVKKKPAELTKAPAAFPSTTLSRYISAEARRRIQDRSGGQCEFVQPRTGKRCESRYQMQFDHIEPYALGGTSKFENIRHVCANHNAYLGRVMYRPEAMLLFEQRA